MARKQQKIKVVSYVRVGDELVETGSLTPEQKRQLGTWLKTTYLNTLFAGQARFYPAANEQEDQNGKDSGDHETAVYGCL